MNKKLTSVVVLFSFLLTLVNAEAGWVQVSYSVKKMTSSGYTDSSEPNHDEKSTSDSEEDITKSRETDEYDTLFVCICGLSKDTLLNLHYTHQHLIYKEHHGELIVPPPKS